MTDSVQVSAEAKAQAKKHCKETGDKLKTFCSNALLNATQPNKFESAKLILLMDEKFGSSVNREIFDRIGKEGKVLSTDIKGRQLDSYLSLFETLNSFHQEGLFVNSMFWISYAHITMVTFRNKEVLKRVAEAQKIDEQLFVGAVEMAEAFEEAEKEVD